MKLHNKLLGIVFVLFCFVLSLAPLCSASEVTGKCGPNCTYTLSEDGQLRITGTGTITKKFNEDEQLNKKDCHRRRH